MLHNYIHIGEPSSAMKEGTKQFLLNSEPSKPGLKADSPKTEKDLEEEWAEYLFNLAKIRKIRLNKKYVNE